MNPDQVTQTIETHWALAAAGLSDWIWGHASIRADDGEGIYIKSSGWAFEEIDADKIVKVGWEGRRQEGTGTVHAEVPIHTQIMAARPDVCSVVHVHAPAITAFASLDQPMRAISHEGVFFAGNLPRFEVTGDLVRTRELGDALASDLGNAAAIIIPQHGLVAVGVDHAAAVMHAILLERACRIQLTAAAAGGPAVWSDDDEVAAKRQTAFSPFHRTYDYLVRCGARLHQATLS